MKDSVSSVLKNYKTREKGDLIPILQDVQKMDGYITPGTIEKISRHLRISGNHIFGVATFYSQFRFVPPGRHSINICLGTACHVRGGDFLLTALKNELGIEPGESTEDNRFDLERVACLGCCALAPVVQIDDDIHGRLSVIKLKKALNDYE